MKVSDENLHIIANNVHSVSITSNSNDNNIVVYNNLTKNKVTLAIIDEIGLQDIINIITDFIIDNNSICKMVSGTDVNIYCEIPKDDIKLKCSIYYSDTSRYNYLLNLMEGHYDNYTTEFEPIILKKFVEDIIISLIRG